ncbi:aminotransferase class III-fold pyridoxal phosphate-dependent enzyme [Sneathiella sp.]|uniref:aminotransferase class III-fold pyridoxal phosphate-dependent enzyme n=1 Tax=Sneathiella sp. TaxID=1964365 RepID=UPI0035666E4E
MYYWSIDGTKIIDGSSGLFCCAMGHCRPEISTAVADQISKLDYSPHFEMGSLPSYELARRLAEITPGDLNCIFFVNSGSESIESALKIAMVISSQ